MTQKIKGNLKPCPFCGGIGFVNKHTFITDMSSTYGITCVNCRAETRQFYKTIEDAENAWNRRIDDD